VPRFDRAPRRDVVSTGDGTEPVIIRFVTDNAGPWFLHCHIDWHLEAGLAVVFAEDIASIAASNKPSRESPELRIKHTLTDPLQLRGVLLLHNGVLTMMIRCLGIQREGCLLFSVFLIGNF
jgi:hypothetical protein